MSSIEKLFDLASDILDSRDLCLFLFVDVTQIDDNEYLKTLRSWTQLLVCTSVQKEKFLIYFDVKRLIDSTICQ